MLPRRQIATIDITTNKELEDLTHLHLPVYRTVQLRCVLVVHDCKYRLNVCSRRLNASPLTIYQKILKSYRSQVRTHRFDRADPISILGFFTNLKLTSDASGIHERAAMQTMLRFVANHVASSLNGCIVQSDGIEGIATKVKSNGAKLETPVLDHMQKW